MRRIYTVEGQVTSLKEYLLTDGRVSATALKKIKYTGLFLNGERVTVRATVHPGDVIELIYPTPARLWENNIGRFGTQKTRGQGPFTTLETRRWMAELQVIESFHAGYGDWVFR